MPEIDGVSLPFLPAGGVGQLRQSSVPATVSPQGPSFQEVFDEELSKVKFSAHARARLQSRELELDQQQMTRLENAVEIADAKGAGQSLVMLDDRALIVNVPNRTVITVVDGQQGSEKVITNIDTAVIA